MFNTRNTLLRFCGSFLLRPFEAMEDKDGGQSKLNNKGFTLIELLVVIAIIGLISSLALVGMKGSTGKARISKSLEFSQTLMNTTGVDAVGVWSFDEGVENICSGGEDVCDKSGYGNHGTITGATFVTGEDNTPHWYVNEGEGRWALEFNGINDKVDIPTSSSLQLAKNFTWEFWYRPNELNKDQYLLARGHDMNRIRQTSNNKLQFNLDWGAIGNVDSTFNVKIGRWYHVVGVYDTSKMYLYVNGTLDNSVVASGDDTRRITHPYRLGYQSWTPASYLNGLIDEVRIYERALSSSEIQQHYAESAPRHNLALK